MIASVGGAAGIVIALSLGLLINFVVPGFQVTFSVASIAVSFLTSTVIGISFGFFPARRAASLDPVVALTRE
jgi:macrolide transport system ATP-binding/permease protein